MNSDMEYRMYQTIGELKDRIAELEQANKELREALKWLADETGVDTDPVLNPRRSFVDAHDNAREVLAANEARTK